MPRKKESIEALREEVTKKLNKLKTPIKKVEYLISVTEKYEKKYPELSVEAQKMISQIVEKYEKDLLTFCRKRIREGRLSLFLYPPFTYEAIKEKLKKIDKNSFQLGYQKEIEKGFITQSALSEMVKLTGVKPTEETVEKAYRKIIDHIKEGRYTQERGLEILENAMALFPYIPLPKDLREDVAQLYEKKGSKGRANSIRRFGNF